MTAFEDFVNTELPYRVSIAVSPGTTGLPKFTGTGKVTELIKCNYAAGGDPGATNDSTEGYSVGSLWHDTTGNHAWICLDATEDAAVWKQLDAAGVTDHGALAGLDDNDHGAIYYTEAEVNALLHAESHSVTSHSDVTDATGTQLEELTGGGATTLHSHAGGGSGDVVGPSAVTDDSIVGFDGTTGKLIRELPVTITTAGGIHTFKPAESHSIIIAPYGSGSTLLLGNALTRGIIVAPFAGSDLILAATGATNIALNVVDGDVVISGGSLLLPVYPEGLVWATDTHIKATTGVDQSSIGIEADDAITLNAVNGTTGYISLYSKLLYLFNGIPVTKPEAGNDGHFLKYTHGTPAIEWAAGAGGVTDHGALTGLADDDHSQYHNDTRGNVLYFGKTEHLNASAGAGDAGKPIKLDAAGHIDATMINDGDVAHDSLGGLTANNHHAQLHVASHALGEADELSHDAIAGLGDDDHTQYHNDTRGDTRYFTKAEHLNSSAGAGDAGKPIKLDAAGHVNGTMLVKCEYAKTVAPTANDDSGDGYTVGSSWFDTTADKVYLCVDATATAAVWVKVSPEDWTNKFSHGMEYHYPAAGTYFLMALPTGYVDLTLFSLQAETDTGTVDIQLYNRQHGSLDTGTTGLLTAVLEADDDSETATSGDFATALITGGWIFVNFSNVTGSPSVCRVTLTYTRSEHT